MAQSLLGGATERKRINIEEATGTSYKVKVSLCFPFYTDCMSIVRLRGIFYGKRLV
jgi:hypothetical protein